MNLNNNNIRTCITMITGFMQTPKCLELLSMLPHAFCHVHSVCIYYSAVIYLTCDARLFCLHVYVMVAIFGWF